MQQRKSKYTDRDRAVVYAELQANNGQVNTAARNSGLPRTTVREWKRMWEAEGVPPEVLDAVPGVVTDFVEDATRVRDKLLMRLETMADHEKMTGREITTGIGVLTDKIRAYRGLDTVREHRHTIEIPAMTELKQELGTALQELVAAGRDRQQVIDDVIELEPSKWKELTPVE